MVRVANIILPVGELDVSSWYPLSPSPIQLYIPTTKCIKADAYMPVTVAKRTLLDIECRLSAPKLKNI